MRIHPLVPALAALALAACGEAEPAPLDARTAALTADANFRRVAVELADASGFLFASKFLGAPLAGGCDAAADGPATAFDAPCEAADPGAFAEAIADFLGDRIFTEANVERGGPDLVFRLRPEVVCEAGDEACREILGEVPVRLLVTSDTEGDLDVAVLVGDDRVETFDIGLHASELEVQADLGGIRRALALLGVPADALPAVMKGRLALGVARHGAGDFTTSLSVLEAMAVHGGGWELDLATALPAVAARIDEARHRATVNLGLGALDLRAPLAAFADPEVEAPAEGTVGLHLAGLTGETTLEAAQADETLRLSGVGLGNEPSAVDVGGTPVFTLDLNPLAGRVFDLVATVDDGGTTLAFAPSFDLGLGFFFGSAVHPFDVPDWALDETLRIRLDGAATPTVRLAGFEALAEVIAGVLHLESSSLAPIDVEAGMCLLASPAEEAPATHPFDGLVAGSCTL